MTWEQLSEEDRAIVAEEAKNTGDMISNLGQQRVDDDLATILAAGLGITIPNRAAFEELSKDIYKEFVGTLRRAGLVDEILAMRQYRNSRSFDLDHKTLRTRGACDGVRTLQPTRYQ